MKKLISLVLALALVLATCSVAFAASWTGNGGNKTITVNKAMKGETYSIYQLFDATTNGTDIAYTLLDGVTAIPTEVAGIFQIETLTDSTTNLTYKAITKIGTPSDEDIQTALKAYAAGSGAAHKVGEITCENDKVEFTGLKDGYYVIVSSFKGTVNKCIGTSTTDSGKNVYEKNETVPQPVKKVDGVDYNIGDTITYEVEFPGANFIGSGASAKVVSHYEIKDICPPFMTDVTVQEVKVIEVEGTKETTITPTPQFDSDKKFVIEWATKDSENHWHPKYINGAKVYVKYTAKLGKISNTVTANVNQVIITPYYDGQPSEDHWHDEEEIYTYGAALKKVDDNGYALAGAKFKFAGVKATETAPGVYTVETVNAASGEETEMTVNSEGLLYIIGLKAGKTLTGEETVAPVGFNKLEGTFSLPVPASGVLTKQVISKTGYEKRDNFGNLIEWNEQTFTGAVEKVQDLSALDPYAITITNHKGTELPSTGGIGTTIFYILGGLLVIGAAVILVARRKAQD